MPKALADIQAEGFAGNPSAFAAGAGLSGVGVVTVPNNSLEHEQTIAAVGVTPASRIMLTLAPAQDADENDPSMTDLIAMAGAPGTDQITISAAFSSPMAGPLSINWSAV